MRWCIPALGFALGGLSTAQNPGPFFDPAMPIHATPVDAGAAGVIARGLLVRVGDGQWVVFDQDLLRPALWFAAKPGSDPLTLETMAQTSWFQPTRKAGVNHPKPLAAGPVTALAPALPGIGGGVADLLRDPRPVFGGDPGRGGLEASGRKFLGYDVSSATAVVDYQHAGTRVREWLAADSGTLHRHLAAAPGPELVFLVARGDFRVTTAATAVSGGLAVTSNHPGLKLETADGHLVARLAASAAERRVTLGHSRGNPAAAKATPAIPNGRTTRWPSARETKINANATSGSGWALDDIALPLPNPWNRRVRPADLAFVSPENAALVTFEGDVWKLDLAAAQVRWRRIASGLSEPLSIGQHGGVIQVFTRNGLVRLHDRNGNGETDYYENHSSLMKQTASTRGYPLDMEIDAAGRTIFTLGGIATDGKGITNQAPENPHSGAVLAVSPDGSELEVIASHSREPFIALDPVADRLALSDQQGHYVPSSGIFPVTPGADFGYGGRRDGAATGAAVWIPHTLDPSSASPLWLRGTGFTAWEGALLNLSYGNGELFLVRPDGGWPARRGAVIPLGIATGLPLLHARAHPSDGSLWLAAFRIYDSRAPALEGLSRLRRTAGPLAAPTDAWIFQQGVVIAFDGELDPASIDAGRLQAREWQYRAGPGYGSPRFKRDGSQGSDALATGGAWPSKDGKRVFVHLPGLQPTMQLELVHPFRVAGADGDPSPVYFSAATLAPAPWIELGFDPPDLTGAVAGVRGDAVADATPTAAAGKELATRYGCTACHSIDGKLEGHSGPTWKNLFESDRKLTDGTTRRADAAYLRQAIVAPETTVAEGYQPGMASYAGVLDEAEIDSIILYIESLK
jgi:mono/diheme cytochrome c family protein